MLCIFSLSSISINLAWNCCEVVYFYCNRTVILWVFYEVGFLVTKRVQVETLRRELLVCNPFVHSGFAHLPHRGCGHAELRSISCVLLHSVHLI